MLPNWEKAQELWQGVQNLDVLDEHGTSHPLNTLLAKTPQVFVFVRHFGCLFCRQQAGEAHLLEEAARAMGGGLAVIGCGTSEHLGSFRQASGYTGQLYTNPGLEIYTMLGFIRSWPGMLAPRAVQSAFQALKKGYRPGMLQGDILQLGGVLVTGSENRPALLFRSRWAGDHPPATDLTLLLQANA
ncbi:MAG: hypothetical protein CSA34_03135 [Desulfobulbus propionicus]|nr:MAG: hypothetical protein CSA34_03135 [Desulfobulbus propionicus]